MWPNPQKTAENFIFCAVLWCHVFIVQWWNRPKQEACAKEACQISKMELFAKKLIIFAKSAILYIWKGSKYGSVIRVFVLRFFKKSPSKTQQNLHKNTWDGGPLLVMRDFSVWSFNKQRTWLQVFSNEFL